MLDLQREFNQSTLGEAYMFFATHNPGDSLVFVGDRRLVEEIISLGRKEGVEISVVFDEIPFGQHVLTLVSRVEEVHPTPDVLPPLLQRVRASLLSAISVVFKPFLKK
jgi:hypothetical protein